MFGKPGVGSCIGSREGDRGRAAGAMPACVRRPRPVSRSACGWLLVLLALCVAWQAGWQAIARAGAGAHLHLLAVHASGGQHDHDHGHRHARPAADHAHGPGTAGVVMLAEEAAGNGAAPVRSGGKRMLLDLEAALGGRVPPLQPGARGRHAALPGVSFESRPIPPLERPPIG